MYTPVKIHQLSATQKRKLRKGDKAIIKQGTGHTVFLSQEQKKKFDRACTKGKGLTVQFDPYQQDEHEGSGLFSSAKKLARAKKNELVKIGKQRIREEGLKAIPGLQDMARSQGRKYIDQARARATQSLDDAVDYGSARVSRELEEPKVRSYEENADGEFELEGEGFKEFIGQVKRAKIGKKVIGFVKDQKIGKRLSDAIVKRALKTIAGGGTRGRPRGRPRGRGRGGALMPAGY
jgi:hypothetical protein